MPFKPPLTRADLVAIQERNAESADVRTLLWEVKRLRALALRTHDLLRQGTSSTGAMMANSLRTTLKDEPVVKEQPQL